MYTVRQYRFHFMYKTPEIVSSLALFVMSMTSAVKVGLCQIRQCSPVKQHEFDKFWINPNVSTCVYIAAK